MSSDICDVIDRATDEIRETPDIALGIEISDRINKSELEYFFILFK